MSWRAACWLLVSVLFLAACESKGSEAEKEGENANTPAARTVRAFYDAADHSAGQKACALLTARGISQIVHVPSRAACVTTVNAFSPGSFSNVLHIEGVDEHGDNAFTVAALLKGRSAGTYTVVQRAGRLLIDGFESEEG